MNGACATMPFTPITALPTPEPRVIKVAGLAVAMNKLDDRDADNNVPAEAAPATAIDITP